VAPRLAFTHRIDSNIDAERDKIVDDLTAAAAVAARTDVARTPPAERVMLNDGTTPVVTDWRLAVLELKPAR
jgi:hypothetical protein